MNLAARASLLFLVSCVGAFLLMDRSIVVYDEGIVLTGALRVLAGDLLHRDFYANYGPGQFYALAALFQVFGQDMLVERWWDIVVRSGIVVLSFLLLHGRVRPLLAWSAALLCASWLWSVGHPAYPLYPALLTALAAAWFMARGLESGNRRDAMLAGTCVALTTLFRYDVGFYALVALLAGGVGREQFARRGERGTLLGTPVRLVLFTAAGGVGALLLLYAATGVLPHFLHDMVFYPAEHYARARSLPFPPLGALLYLVNLRFVAIYLPLVACAAGALALWRSVRSGDAAQEPARVMAFLLVPLVALFYLKGVVRVSLDHVQLSLLPSLVLLALAWELSRGRAARAAVGVLCALNLAVAVASVQERVEEHTITADAVPTAGWGVLSLPVQHAADDRNRAVRYLAQHARPGERTFVGTVRHDRIFINDVSAYFLSGHLPATKWHHFDPGLQNAPLVQAAMIQELQAQKPSYAWVESTFDAVVEPNESARSSGVHMLDNYLAWAYEPAEVFGTILILKRKAVPGS